MHEICQTSLYLKGSKHTSGGGGRVCYVPGLKLQNNTVVSLTTADPTNFLSDRKLRNIYGIRDNGVGRFTYRVSRVKLTAQFPLKLFVVNNESYLF